MATIFRRALSVAAFLVGQAACYAGIAGAQTPTQLPPPAMTIQIFNPPSNTYNIYPVVSVGGASSTDTWMQAYFQLTTDQVSSANYPYPRAGIPRFYVNCCAAGENGIPPGGSVTVTLPFVSPTLTSITNINPKDAAPPGQFADWWQGGDINMFTNPNSAESPPQALTNIYNAETTTLPLNSYPPTCVGQPPTNGCTLHFFFDAASIANSVPQQLLEFTLGADPINPENNKPGQSHFLFQTNNVDYDVSYVNDAYLPAVMEPYGNPLVGWIGAANTIDDFTMAIQNFRNTANLGAGWPVYTGTSKIASALEIFLSYVPDQYDPNLTQSQPVIAMINLLDGCVKGATNSICGPIRDVVALLNANYDHYVKSYKDPTLGCNQTLQPVALTDQLLRAHLWGWGPFNENCAADANQLYDTPGYTDPTKTPNYAAVKAEFDALQYWDNFPVTGQYGQFDPYVALIHGKTFINAPYTYAYSVDDAVGNMQTDGTGLIIEVGGTDDLPNPDHATPNVHMPFGVSSTDKETGTTVTFEKYGRCATSSTQYTPVNPNFSSFDVPLGVDDATIKSCLITFVDNYNRTYQFTVNNGPPFPLDKEVTDPGHAFIDCGKNNTDQINTTWCNNIYAYQETDPNNPVNPTLDYYVVVPAPAPIAPGSRRRP